MIVHTFQQGLLSTNCYVLQHQNTCVVVDVAFVSQELENFILQNKLQLQAVLLTHGHFDHCGGVEHLLQTVGKADVFVHVEDVELCKTAQQNPWGVPCQNCIPTKTYGQGRLCVGSFEFEVLHTPGHTHGSVVLLCQDKMFAGDTLFCGSIGRTDFAESNKTAMKNSLQKIKQIQGDYTVFCGHGPATLLSKEKETNVFLCH